MVAFESAVVAYFVDAADILGVPKSVAAVYGICFATPEPLSFSEIDERLDISSGSISQGLRVLRDVGALRLACEAASSAEPDTKHRDYYEPELELRNLIAAFLDQRLERGLKAGRARLGALTRCVPKTSAASGKILGSRLRSLEKWQDKTCALMPVVKAFLKAP